jgi:two-component system, OmpR family, KDP operon response regulator KdpE
MPCVLVCDQDAASVETVHVLLGSSGFSVIEAATGEQAIELAALHTPRAALLDVVLPDIDGVEVCRRLREWSDMAIIVLSAIDEEDTKVRALHAGADDYVTKPFATGELVARRCSAPTGSRSISRPIWCGATVRRSV